MHRTRPRFLASSAKPLAAGRWRERQVVKPHSACSVAAVVVSPLTARQDHSAHDLRREPASAQKSHLTGASRRIQRRACAVPVFFTPDLTRTTFFGGLQCVHRVSIQSNAMLLQLLPDSQVAKPPLARCDARLGKALLRQVAVGLEPDQDRFDFNLGIRGWRFGAAVLVIAIVGTGRPIVAATQGLANWPSLTPAQQPEQLAPQLNAAVLAPCQPLQCTGFDRERERWHAAAEGVADAPRPGPTLARRSTDAARLGPPPTRDQPAAAAPLAKAAACNGTPKASRTLFSISSAISGFSRKNSRALSLPWPIFSPL